MTAERLRRHRANMKKLNEQLIKPYIPTLIIRECRKCEIKKEMPSNCYFCSTCKDTLDWKTEHGYKVRV